MANYTPTQLNELIDILSVPTYFAKEDLLIQKILNKLKDKNLMINRDKIGNIYIKKGKPESEIYPCVVAHLDTVHEIKEFVVHNDSNKYLSAKLFDGTPYGIGGDDKAGVFACLQLLERIENIKVVFFVGEEFGCVGSRLSDKSFFEDVGYVIQFDAPEHNWITYKSMGVKLFDKDDIFFELIEPILKEYMGDKLWLGNHPYTDVCAIRKYVPVNCINLSIGYYNMHTVNEYVNIDVCFNCIEMGEKIIQILDNTRYPLFEIINEHAGFLDNENTLKRLENQYMGEKNKGLN